MDLLRREPVAVFGWLQTLLLAVLTLLAAFDIWTPTDAQLAALVGVYTAATALVTWFVRGQVSPARPADPGDVLPEG